MATPIKLPRLNKLAPTVESTFLKIIEEAGELARVVLAFLPYEEMDREQLLNSTTGAEIMEQVCEELLDVAQTCVSMIFVVEENYGVKMDQLIQSHLQKLVDKGYNYNRQQQYFITSQPSEHYKYLQLPRLVAEGVTLLTTVCKLLEEIGEAGQFWGKGQGKSGETATMKSDELMIAYSLELLDIAQCCFTMMYILEEKYRIDFALLIARHISKLERKGYLA